MKKIILLFGCITALSFSNAQSDNSFLNLIGKADNSAEVTDFVNTYHLVMANNTHFVSNNGVELIFKDGLVNEIHLYRGSKVYGDFEGNLPAGLKFGMSSAEVKSLLGKPSITYNSGYCEFTKDNHILSCWFEGGVLHQVVVSAKSSL